MNDEKKRKKKHRSRSRSHEKDRKRNKSSSTEKEKKRKRSSSKNKKIKTNVLKKTITEVEKELNTIIENSRYIKSSNFSTLGPDLGMNFLQTLSGAQAAKVDRKLYIGNLPSGISPSTLVKLLNAALHSLNIVNSGDPVLSAWISTDGHYAFVEFRSADEANLGFQLNNISILGQPLKVGRPKTYQGAISMLDEGNICNTVAAALQAGTMNTPIIGRKVTFPCRVLCFEGITKNLKIDDEDIYNEVYADMKEEVVRYGRVMSISIPKKDQPGNGNIYMEFYTLEESKETRRQLSGRKFNGKTVKIIYYPEDKYKVRDFSFVNTIVNMNSEDSLEIN